MKTLRIFGRIALAGLLITASGLASDYIPLELGTQGNSTASTQRLFIYVGINDGPVQKYLFDTGSSGFNAAYYDGPYTGPEPNPAFWTNNGTITTNATVSYGVGNDTFSYQLNEVKVSKIKIYNSTDFLTPAKTLTSTDGFQIGQVVNRLTSDGSVDTTFIDNLKTGAAPERGVYGTFGASLFTGIVNGSSANGTASSFVNASVLGQAEKTGWVVSANSGSAAYVLLGIDDSIRAQFDSAMDWTGPDGPAFPNSNANASSEYGGGNMTYTISGNGSNLPPWTSDTLLDTGTGNNNLNYFGGNLTAFETVPPLVDAGMVITASGTSSGSGTYTIDPTTDNLNPPTYNVNIRTDATHSTLGIGFFLANSVAFDLENKQTLYTNVVVVPEPAIASLLTFASLAGMGLFRRRK
jgi:hypothetical protein